ncbi:MAG: transcription antitermination factor NusB [Candidatus Hydrogenedentes bacterium]|nr:transcription antitermination factor NusB [Candidatus Hydrogenedentota bacterium]
MAESYEIRHKARIYALQYLFGLEFREFEGEDDIKTFWEYFPAKKSIRKYAEFIIKGVIEHKGEIESTIKNNLTNWDYRRVGNIEKVVMKIAIYECLISKKVNPKVAINEALEIAHLFATEESPRFINGVLDKILNSAQMK